jgi:glutamate formiminotransferase/formiminotetrahydrofolate cyclodeaminase
MRISSDQFDLMNAMVEEGNPNSVSDAGVGASCLLAAVEGGWMNVMINLPGLKNKDRAMSFKKEADELLEKGRAQKDKIFSMVIDKIGSPK